MFEKFKRIKNVIVGEIGVPNLGELKESTKKTATNIKNEIMSGKLKDKLFQFGIEVEQNFKKMTERKGD